MKYQLWLDNYSGLGTSKKNHIVNDSLSARDIYYMEEASLKKIEYLTAREIEGMIDKRKKTDLEKLWNDFISKGISFTSLEQENYPNRIKNITNSPYILYYIGKLPDEKRKTIAIVGARGRSAYGSQIAQKLGEELAARGIQVISGLARGIDADGHRGALNKKGETFAVLGCGVDICYPKANQYIYNDIIQKGGIISELMPGTQPKACFFPMRNRIISGFSDAVIVVEAREKSGSLITADFAMEQGKDVYAVPGRITDELSQGCNRLIKQGAGVILSPQDLLEDLQLLSDNNCIQMDFLKKLLEKDESLVYSLTDFRPIDLGTLLEKTTFDISELITILHSLEEKGFITEVFPNHYVRDI